MSNSCSLTFQNIPSEKTILGSRELLDLSNFLSIQPKNLNMKYAISLSFSLVLFLSACSQPHPSSEETFSAPKLNDDFGSYWYQGKAELASYELKQARYGEIHEGHAVLIFVTEPFSQSKLVKLDNPGGAGTDEVTVMKLNFTRKFNTGIYPYSVMQSIFSPVSMDRYPHMLKTSFSSQEWCGHTFAQLELDKKGYHLTGHSYFESEGEESRDLPLALLEDELWNRIRIQPQGLPTGNQTLIPSMTFSRLKHIPMQPQAVELTLEAGETESTYTIAYQDLPRTVEIRFETAFPHRILGWKETSSGGFGGGSLTTEATLIKTIQSPYWTKNRKSDSYLRQELGIE
ncbi:hypothetical protein [Pontibacter sp. G13]|uniref:hypothetical protein n=1 Tax=Pontibacter sp. G13 TaxID=3074898 RepID=UPI002889211B|nr:hypothetical protein [Pontibacter sp. G13]WNJ16836.1 hypothetical protein RJD25_18385 [Pontibacter sp. G13]